MEVLAYEMPTPCSLKLPHFAPLFVRSTFAKILVTVLLTHLHNLLLLIPIGTPCTRTAVSSYPGTSHTKCLYWAGNAVILNFPVSWGLF